MRSVSESGRKTAPSGDVPLGERGTTSSSPSPRCVDNARHGDEAVLGKANDPGETKLEANSNSTLEITDDHLDVTLGGMPEPSGAGSS